MNRIFVIVAAVCCGLAFTADAQRFITLEEIWQRGTFNPKSVPGFNFMQDGKHYTRLEQNKIQQCDLTTGELVQTILDASALQGVAGFNGRMQGYSFSADERKILLWSDIEPIYRYSTRAWFFVYDRQQRTLQAVFDGGKHSLATFNPQADKVAFVFDNNLYIKDLKLDEIRQITTDGQANAIINGGMDWVYEEEFALKQGYQWSADGHRIAYYRFDEREVKQFSMELYNNELYPGSVTFKYPKVGEANSIVTIHVYNLLTGRSTQVDTGEETDIYIPRIQWANAPEQLCIFRMNRHQNQLELLLVNTSTGALEIIYSEVNKYYIEEAVLDDFTFLKDGKSILFTAELDGWRHIYHYTFVGKQKQLRQITKGNWEVTRVYGVDERSGLIYYQAAERSPMERQVYAISLDGKKRLTLANAPGTNNAQFSSTYDYYVVTHSTINTPDNYTVYDRNGKALRVIEDNMALRKLQEDFRVGQVEFFQFTTSEGVALNGWMMKPKNFKADQKYPVLMFVYGGPGSQQVNDAWKGANYWWFQMLTQQEFVVVCVDNRGTGGRGEEFKKMTYLQLGKYETIDQIEAAKYLRAQPYVDAQRIAIFGWSYGGYMSSLAVLKGNDVFRAAIAVAPVTNWKWYDTIYTERYMRTEKENPEGYRDNSPVNFADRLRGDYLLIHGMADDNVHFQHSVEIANALIRANKQFETYYYPNRNHGIYGGSTRLHLYTKMTRFLEERVKGADLPLGQKRAIPRMQLMEIDGVIKE